MQWVGADWAVNSVQCQSTAGTLFKWKQNVYEMKLQDIYVIFLPITKELFPILSMFACAGRVLLEVWVYSVGCTAKSICRSERCLSKPPYCLPGRQLSLKNTLLQVHHLCYEFMVRFLFRPRVHRAKMSCGSGGAACIFPVGKDVINGLLTTGETTWKGKAWDLTTKMVQRSGGLQLHFSCG